MKKIQTLLLVTLLLNVASAIAQKSNSGDKDMNANKDAAMKSWMDNMTPGEQHKMLAKSAGDWKADVTQYMDPSQPPMKTQSTVHNEMIMGGRYLSTRWSGNMMGMPFEGSGTMGYDNGKKKYVSTWIDNMGTGISYMEGTMSGDGKSVEFKGTMYDPMQKKDVAMREVIHFNSDNDQAYEFYQDMMGKETKMMEMHLTR